MAEWGIVAARLLQFGSALILLGWSLFCLYGIRRGETGESVGRWSQPRLGVLIAAATAFVGVFWWVASQAAIFFPLAGVSDPEPIWIILTETRFGRIALLRALLLALALCAILLLAPTRRFWIALSVVSTAIVASFAWTGHGIFDSGLNGILHTGADVLHLLAAAIWIGALVPLLLLILRSLHTQTELDTQKTLLGLERFSGIGPALVAILVLTGLVNSWFLVGAAQWQAIFTTNYGITLSLKLALFLFMLLLGALNRYRLSPALRDAMAQSNLPSATLRRLRTSILTETSLALLVLAAVAFLGTLEPPVSAGL